MTPLPAATDDAIRTLASTILARRTYARFRPDTEILGLLRRWQSWLRAATDWLRELSVASPWLYACLVGALLLTAAALLAHLVYTLRVALAAGRAAIPDTHGGGAADFLAEAEALSRRGKFLEAAHRMQLAVIDVLLRRRAIELSRADPNRTLRARLHAAPLPAALRGDLVQLLDRFERSWFRDRTEDRDLYEAWRESASAPGHAAGGAVSPALWRSALAAAGVLIADRAARRRRQP